jgi:AraC-like DNA-binding protein
MKGKSASYHVVDGIELFEGVLAEHKFPWHYHGTYTIVFINHGMMKYVYSDKEITVRENQVHIVNPYTSHFNIPIGECVYKAIFLPIAYIVAKEAENMLVRFCQDISTSEKLIHLLEKTFSDLKNAKLQTESALIVSTISKSILRYFEHDTQTIIRDERIEMAIHFIESNLDTKLTVTKIATKANLSRFHFQRLFKTHTGLTVNDFIQQLRTERGKSLLSAGQRIVETCYETGYFDSSHFNKAFTKMWAIKPSDLK